jgi:glycosidase
MRNIRYICFLLFFLGCQNSKEATTVKSSSDLAIEEPPKWAREVIWYEIGVDRFRNGDISNDPTPQDIVGAYPDLVPEGWSVTPWTQDWYKHDPYFKNATNQPDINGNRLEKFVDLVQMRRYGGDLQGVLDKIDYLDSLGITAVYFRPLNDAPSLHKYDARNWRHIDVNFGPDPKKDKQTIASEIPDDPKTWKMTEADKMFLKVIDEFHKREIKVILDYSWNHTGKEFWAWKDVLKNQIKSEYKEWYWIERFDNPKTSKNEFEYDGWVGVPTLPEIKETQKQDASKRITVFEGDIYSQGAKQHIFNVAKRWLDPNGDGDPTDGVDGYRLDVAAEIPLGFWRDFRKHVRQINPEAYLLGEIWWEEWPDKLMDPEPFLKGDVFDAVMNYRWYKAVRQFFNESPDKISAGQLIDSLNGYRSNLRKENNYVMMNYTGGFDTPRVLTSLFNKNKYKYYCKAHENPDYKIHRPDAATFETLKLLLVQQYTYIGAPHIYAGDEMGMWGADDPSSRKPLIWTDYTFEDERAHPLGKEKPMDKVEFNLDLFQFHQQLIRIRKANPILIHGELEFLNVGDSKELLAYRRYNNTDEIIVVFNHKNTSEKIEIAKGFKGVYKDILDASKVESDQDKLVISLPPRKATLLKYHH